VSTGIWLLTLATNIFVTFAAAIAFFDATRRPAQAFEIIGRGSRAIWMIGLALGSVIVFFIGMLSLPGIVATVATIVYHVDQKPKLNEIMRSRD
jgi:predicted PurR-regulated permease PerM